MVSWGLPGNLQADFFDLTEEGVRISDKIGVDANSPEGPGPLASLGLPFFPRRPDQNDDR